MKFIYIRHKISVLPHTEHSPSLLQRQTT